MTILYSSLHKRKAYFIAILFVVCFVFTADILDLREELRFLPCPYSSLDNNVTTGITTSIVFETESGSHFALRRSDVIGYNLFPPFTALWLQGASRLVFINRSSFVFPEFA